MIKVFAIIPARSGSKGIPDKNIAPILGKPLISYTIESAIKSSLLKKIVVSSNDERINNITKSYKKVQFHRRPDFLAADESKVSMTIIDILESYKDFKTYDAVMLLQPTSPIRSGKQIDEAIQLFSNHEEANSLISVCPMDDIHPARMYWKSDQLLNPIMEEFEHRRRQEIPKAYYRNGSIYISRLSMFKQKTEVILKPTLGYVMPSSQLLNIDEPRDLLVAETLIRAWEKGLLN